jgi:hypothetical protein
MDKDRKAKNQLNKKIYKNIELWRNRPLTATYPLRVIWTGSC